MFDLKIPNKVSCVTIWRSLYFVLLIAVPLGWTSHVRAQSPDHAFAVDQKPAVEDAAASTRKSSNVGEKNSPDWVTRFISIAGFVVSLSSLGISGFTFYFARRESQHARRRAAIEFSKLITSPDFRIKVSSLAWQVFVKWLYWKGISAISYKRLICWGYLGWEGRYKDFDPRDKPLHQIEITNKQEHFKTIPASQNGLSEHDALGVWFETWSQLSIMIDKDLADKQAACALLTTQYGYWLPFIVQFSDVLKTASQDLEKENISAPLPSWIKDDVFEKLHAIFAEHNEDFSEKLTALRASLVEEPFKSEKKEIVASLVKDALVARDGENGPDAKSGLAV